MATARAAARKVGVWGSGFAMRSCCTKTGAPAGKPQPANATPSVADAASERPHMSRYSNTPKLVSDHRRARRCRRAPLPGRLNASARRAVCLCSRVVAMHIMCASRASSFQLLARAYERRGRQVVESRRVRCTSDVHFMCIGSSATMRPHAPRKGRTTGAYRPSKGTAAPRKSCADGRSMAPRSSPATAMRKLGARTLTRPPAVRASQVVRV